MEQQDNHGGQSEQIRTDEQIRAGGPPASSAASPPAAWYALTAGRIILGLTLAVGVYLLINFTRFDGEVAWSICKAGLGLGFVIFIHELGHFLVAKWCDVHVTTFSIGFGPAIPGCSFQWGETRYKLAWFPLGGYVQMVGQVDGDESADDSVDDPRSYRNKSVGQRMAIISAGVVMNAILAVICFIIVFQGRGREQQAAVIRDVDSRSPAFQRGLRTSDEVLEIGKYKDHPYFENLMVAVMTSRPGEKVLMVVKYPGQSPRSLEIEPRKDSKDDRPLIGVLSTERLQLATRRDLDPSMRHPVAFESAAARAEPPFEFGDIIIATTDPDDPSKVTPLDPDPRQPDSGYRDYIQFLRRINVLAAEHLVIRVERGPEGARQTVDIKVPPAIHQTMGTRMQMGQITAIRENSPAHNAVQAPQTADGKRIQGDVIVKVEVTEPDGKTKTVFEEKTLDPTRLPFDLRQWANRLHKAKPQPTDQERTVTLTVKRHRKTAGPDYDTVIVPLLWDESYCFDRVTPLASSSPMAIPELGFAYQIKTTVADVLAGAASLLQKGDTIKKARMVYADKDGQMEKGPEIELDEDNWAYVFKAFQSAKEALLSVKRDGQEIELRIKGQPDTGWPRVERGWYLSKDRRLQKADNFVDAIGMGFSDTYDRVTQVFANLRAMITGRVSATKHLGGPITIARAAYRIAGYDIWEFVFFIGLISINLAVINFLPIPVLDGGHMVFLIYEKLRGKPASEGIRIGATYAGLALIATLMVFVLYLDISRLF